VNDKNLIKILDSDSKIINKKEQIKNVFNEELDWSTLPINVSKKNLDFFFNKFELNKKQNKDEDGSFVLFGHYYNYEQEKWENKVTIWICFQNPIRRHFLINKNERRIESYLDIPVQYFSASFSYEKEIIINETHSGHYDRWSNTVPLSVGMGFKIAFENGKSYKATIGPAVSTVFPNDTNIPTNWFFTVSHIFMDDDIGIACADGHAILNCNEQVIGKLIAVHSFSDWAIIEISNTITIMSEVKIDQNDNRLAIDGSIEFLSCPFDNEENFKCPKTVFKSGSTTAVTKGNIYSWGVALNKTLFEKPIEDTLLTKHAIFVQRFNFGSSSTLGSNYFTTNGDSGSPVIAIYGEDNEDKAMLIGIVKGLLNIHTEKILTVVNPINYQTLRDFVTTVKINNVNDSNINTEFDAS
jgi:hypothetical protein